jgi:hypothetical protein
MEELNHVLYGLGHFRLCSLVPKERTMADRKLGIRRATIFVVLAGVVWITSPLFGGRVGGQPPTEPPPPPTPPPVPNLNQKVQGGLEDIRPRPRFNFEISPDTLLRDLLPMPPKARAEAPRLIDDISQVPEIALQEPLKKTPNALKLTAETMAKINHINRVQTDNFMVVLLQERPDLVGLPVAMGDSCRTKGDRTKFFTQALNTIKQARGQGTTKTFTAISNAIALPATIQPELPKDKDVIKEPSGKGVPKPTPSQKVNPGHGGGPVPDLTDLVMEFDTDILVTSPDPDAFWEKFAKLCAQEDKANSKLDPAQLDHVACARIAALMQVLGPESVAMRKGLVKYLASTSHAEATRALAKLAIFAAEDDVRNPAIEALKVRREKDYTAILLQGLRYPLPAVAKRATEAMTKLDRTDLVPELFNFLDEADPRAPTMKDVGAKKVPVIRELVRVNHHRNCLMCHSPAVPNEVPAHVTTAEVPRPDQPLPFPSDGYQNSIPEVLVRLDVTYLRQDFSLMQPVADANPWPEMQRFDFLVRNRVLSDDEAKAFPAPKVGILSPYQRYALAALRELTGRDTAPTPEAWRKLLED